MANNFRVAGFVTGLAIKAPVHTVSLVDIPVLNGAGATIGGYTVSAGDRVLLTAQTNPIENGIYSVEITDWFRTGDCDGNRDLVGGTIVPVWNQVTMTVVLYRLEGDPETAIIGADPLVFVSYYDPSASAEVDTLQSVTTRGNVTIDEMFIRRVAANATALTIDNAGRIVMENVAGDGDINIGNSASDTFQISVNGVAGRFQFTGLTQSLRLLGGGGGTGPSLIFEERGAAEASISGFGQFWVRSSAPNRPTFTDDAGIDQLIDPSISEIISVIASRTNILADKGRTTVFSGSTAAQTMTIPASGSVAFQIGTFLAWDNNGTVPFDIAITTDTLIFADDGTTGTRTLAASGRATAQLIAAATWKISGSQLS